MRNYLCQVGFYAEVMGRTGARPTIHSLRHAADAVELHGEGDEKFVLQVVLDYTTG